MNVIHRIYFWRTNWWNSVWSHQWVTTHLHIQGFPDLTVAPAKKAENLTRRNSSVWLGFHFKRHELKQNFLYFLESEFIDLPEELPKVLKGHWQNLFDAQEGLITLASLKAISPRKLYYWLNDPKLLFLRTNAGWTTANGIQTCGVFWKYRPCSRMRLFPPTWIGMTKLKKRDYFQEALILIFRKVFFQTIVWMHKAQRISKNHVNSCCIFYDILGLHAEVCNIKKLRGQPQTAQRTGEDCWEQREKQHVEEMRGGGRTGQAVCNFRCPM